MKTRTKIITSVIAFILSCVIMFTLAVVNPNTNQVVGALTRTVQLNKNTVDYEAFFNEFDNVELILDEDNNAIKFSGTRTVDAALFKEIDLVSLSDEDDGVDVRYVFDYNADKNEFYLSIIADTEGGEIVDKWFGVPFMGDDGEIDIAFATDDGVIYLSELEESGVLENCGWFSKLFKAVAIVAAVVAVVAVVVAVAVVAGPAIVAAGAAVGSAAATVGAGGAAAAAVTTTAVAASAVTAATAVGTAAMATTAFAVATTTAVVATGIAAASTIAYVADQSNHVEESKGNNGKTESGKENTNADKKVPDYPGDDASKQPGEEWKWKGNGDPNSGKGSWYNPNTGESLHPDLNHPEPIGPHWDYVGPDGTQYRIYPDGSWTVK